MRPRLVHPSLPSPDPLSPVSLVIFDVNGVLYEYDKATRLDRLAQITGTDPTTIDQAIWGSGFEDRGDAGEMDAEQYLRGFGELLAHPLSADAWTDALRASLTPIPPMLSLASHLGTRMKLAVLTNNNLLVRDRMNELFLALRPIFGNEMFVSAEFKCRKPEPKVYRLCVARLGEAASRTLFIDDNAANVAGAEQAGLLGHCHTDDDALIARLAALGLA